MSSWGKTGRGRVTSGVQQPPPAAQSRMAETTSARNEEASSPALNAEAKRASLLAEKQAQMETTLHRHDDLVGGLLWVGGRGS